MSLTSGIVFEGVSSVWNPRSLRQKVPGYEIPELQHILQAASVTSGFLLTCNHEQMSVELTQATAQKITSVRESVNENVNPYAKMSS